MKVGCYYENPWAGKGNPNRISLYIGDNSFLFVYKGRFGRAKYHKEHTSKFTFIKESEHYKKLKAEMANINEEGSK